MKSINKNKNSTSLTKTNKNDELIDRIIRRLNVIVKKPSVISHEKPLMDYLFRQIKTFKNYEIIRNKNLIVAKHNSLESNSNKSSKKTSKKPQIISVHIDRQGFITNKNNEIEYAAFFMQKKHHMIIRVEEYVFKKVISRHIGETIIAYDLISGNKIEERKIIGGEYNFKLKKAIFKLDKKTSVKPGTPWMLKSKVNKFGDYISSQIDNAISVAISFELMKENFKGIIAFTTEEEIGLSWKHLNKFLEENKITTKELIIIDTTPYHYIHTVDKGFVVLRHRDENGRFNKLLTSKAKSICLKKNIPFVFKDEQIKELNKELQKQGKPSRKYGHTELGRIVEHTNSKINGTTIQIPSVRYHTNHEQTSRTALRNFYLLLKKMVL